MLATEHILLESDVPDVPELRTARIVHSRLRLKSRLRRRVVELALIDDLYLSVCASGPRSPISRYVLDLRFVDPAIRLSRHVAWRWMAASAVLAIATAVLLWRIGSSPAAWWRHDWLPAAGTLVALAAGAALVSIYRTTETFRLYSAHGQARLLEFTGGLGTLRAVRRFCTRLVEYLRTAIAARRPSRAEHLRDEMREHYRLRCAGVLTEREYEAGKRRILERHAPGRR